MTTLCVGCGALPEGDVNVDAYPFDKTQCSQNWNPKETPNFHVANAESLPFEDDAFTAIIARHCLEHTDNPLQALREMRRVCSGKVQVWVPSQWKRDMSPSHLYAWSPIELANLMRKAGLRNVKADYTSRVYKWVGWKTTLVNLIVKLFGFYTEIYGEGWK